MSKEPSCEKSGGLGKTPWEKAKISTTTPTVASNTDSTKNAEATVGYEEPGIELRVRNSLMMSPPRAGTTLLKPTAAQYAPQMRRHWKLTAGYAARRLLKNARERSVRLRLKKARPNTSAPQWTAARSEKNWLAASRKTLTVWPIEVEARGGDTPQAYGPRRVPRLKSRPRPRPPRSGPRTRRGPAPPRPRQTPRRPPTPR